MKPAAGGISPAVERQDSMKRCGGGKVWTKIKIGSPPQGIEWEALH
jgi:hypothetical protein